MRIRDSLISRAGAYPFASLRSTAALCLSLCFCSVQAQTAAVPAGASQSVPAQTAGQTWGSLSKVQKASLAPLEKYWDTVSEGQKKKWLAIAQTYPALGTPEKEKLHSRMLEWTALPAKNREAARLNFAESKAVARSDRAANWEAYQALSTAEREKLAQGAKPKPAGAAIAVRPATPEKLTAVPVTRHTPEPERAAVSSQRPINRSTLLPQVPASASSTSLAVPAKP